MKYFGCAWYPEAWPRERWAEDIRLMKEAGINAVRMGEFNWGRFEPQEGKFEFSDYRHLLEKLHENGIAVLLCTPTAAPPKWMSSRYPEILKSDKTGQPVYDGNRRHCCPSSLKFREFSRRITEKMAETFRDSPAIFAWQLDNEIAAEAEHGFCFCDGCAKRFRTHLEMKYRTVENLNAAWNGAFWSGDFTSFDEIDPRNFKRVSWKAEYAQFMSSLYTELAYEQRDILRQVNPSWKITTNSWTSFLPDVAPDEIYPGLDFASCDTYLGNDFLEFSHSFWDYYRNIRGKRQAFTVGETGAWNPVTTQKDAYQVLRTWAWDAFAHGAENLFYFRWRQSLMGEESHPSILPWSGNPGEAYGIISRTIREIRAFSGQHPGLPPPESNVAILTDRLTGFITKYRGDYSYFHAVVRMNQALNENGVHADILPLSLITEHTLSAYKLVILPQIEHLPDAVCRFLHEYRRNGGKILAQCRLNRMDEFGKYRMESAPANLQKLFGLHIDESCNICKGVDFREFEYNERTLPENNRSQNVEFMGKQARLLSFMEKPIPDTCRILQEYTAGLYQGAPLFTEHDGAFYLAAPMNREGLALVMRHLLKQCGIPRFHVPPKCQRIQRGTILFYINNTADTAVFEDDGIELPPYECLRKEIRER